MDSKICKVGETLTSLVYYFTPAYYYDITTMQIIVKSVGIRGRSLHFNVSYFISSGSSMEQRNSLPPIGSFQSPVNVFHTEVCRIYPFPWIERQHFHKRFGSEASCSIFMLHQRF